MKPFHGLDRNSPAFTPARLERAWRRLALPVALAALLLTPIAGGPVSAQSPQPGTAVPQPSVPPGNSPRAEGPAPVAPEIDMDEEDDEGGEGCPYLGQTLELVV